uniref:Uncharacterized protein n=1 Tax=Anguilla anguilla TaxID=7936 RepID=A0A0E9QUJ7_ANGAN
MGGIELPRQPTSSCRPLCVPLTYFS